MDEDKINDIEKRQPSSIFLMLLVTRQVMLEKIYFPGDGEQGKELRTLIQVKSSITA